MKHIRTYSPDKELVEEKREHIVRCAAEVFIKNGYSGTNLREIMKACGMGAGVLYHYIGTKEDILYLVMVAAVERTAKRFEAVKTRCQGLNARDTLTAYIGELIQNAEDEQDSILMNNRELKNLSRNARQVLLDGFMRHISGIENVLIQGVKTGEFKIVDTFLTAHKINSICTSWAMQRWYLRSRYTQEQFTNYVIDDVNKHILM